MHTDAPIIKPSHPKQATIRVLPVRLSVQLTHKRKDAGKPKLNRPTAKSTGGPVGGWTTESVTHGQCDARPTVTFRAAERHRLISLDFVWII